MYVCSKCSSDQVESLLWVDLNTGEMMSGLDEVGEYYCRSCEAHTDVMYKQGLYDEDELETRIKVKQQENEEAD